MLRSGQVGFEPLKCASISATDGFDPPSSHAAFCIAAAGARTAFNSSQPTVASIVSIDLKNSEVLTVWVHL